MGSGPKMSLDVTDAERVAAKEAKDDFKEILKKLEKSVKSIIDLKNAITEQHPTQEELTKKYRGRLLRYRRKIQSVFNDFLLSTKNALEKLTRISDPDMLRLREILAAEVGELSDGAEAVLDLLKEPDREGFTVTLERISAQLEKRQRSVKDVIDTQLFGHLDHDILGKMRISQLRFNMKKRARIIKYLVRSK